MGDPGIAQVHVVFDEQERAVRFEEGSDVAQDFFLVPEIMQGVCHDDAVERGNIERAGKIVRKQDQVRGRFEAGAVGVFEIVEGGSAFVHRVDRCVESDQFAQGEGERAAARAEVCPRAAGG